MSVFARFSSRFWERHWILRIKSVWLPLPHEFLLKFLQNTSIYFHFTVFIPLPGVNWNFKLNQNHHIKKVSGDELKENKTLLATYIKNFHGKFRLTDNKSLKLYSKNTLLNVGLRWENWADSLDNLSTKISDFSEFIALHSSDEIWSFWKRSDGFSICSRTPLNKHSPRNIAHLSYKSYSPDFSQILRHE